MADPGRDVADLGRAMSLRVFGAASIIAAFALATLMLHAGEPGSLSWWGLAAPFALWIIGPAVAPYLIARRSHRRSVLLAMIGFFGVSSVVAGVAYFDAFFRSDSSTAALIFVFLPLYQWIALGLVTGTLLVGTRRAMRRGRAGGTRDAHP